MKNFKAWKVGASEFYTFETNSFVGDCVMPTRVYLEVDYMNNYIKGDVVRHRVEAILSQDETVQFLKVIPLKKRLSNFEHLL